jgi:AcrR family transcriptional regulator
VRRKSTGVSDRIDARVRRTRAQIDAAFVGLLQHRAYDGIRVSDVARRSGVGRATFYAHYAGKDALLRAQMERLVAALLRPSPPGRALFDGTPFFAHVLGAPRLYRSLMAGAGRRVAEATVEARIAALLAGAPQMDEVPAPLVARVTAYALMGLVSFWVGRGEETTAAAMQAQLEALCGGPALTPRARALRTP